MDGDPQQDSMRHQKSKSLTVCTQRLRKLVASWSLAFRTAWLDCLCVPPLELVVPVQDHFGGSGHLKLHGVVYKRKRSGSVAWPALQRWRFASTCSDSFKIQAVIDAELQAE